MNASMVKGISFKRKSFVQGGWDENFVTLWFEPDHPKPGCHCKFALNTCK